MSYGLGPLDWTTGLQTMKHQQIHFRHVDSFNLYCNLERYCFLFMWFMYPFDVCYITHLIVLSRILLCVQWLLLETTTSSFRIVAMFFHERTRVVNVSCNFTEDLVVSRREASTCNCIMTNVMHKFLFYLFIYFCLTRVGLSFSPSSEAGVQLR
jgi:hypothetical protein